MNTIGKKRWPGWIKRAVAKRKNIEVKEHKGSYYAYSIRSVWDKKKKRAKKISKYLGRVRKGGITTSYETAVRGMYEYGHVRFLRYLLERGKLLKPLKEIFPDSWKIIFAFACNRLIDPRPIKSMGSWCEKTYLPKMLETNIYPKKITTILNVVGVTWKSQLEFFDRIIAPGENIIYDGSVIFSSSDIPLCEFGYNKENLFLKKINIVVAFSKDRKIPVFFRIFPGSIHEINSLRLFLEEIGDKNIILVFDKGLVKGKLLDRTHEMGLKFVCPLKRNSQKINYQAKMRSFFMYRGRPIRHCSRRSGKFFIYLYEDFSLKSEEQKTYYSLLSKGKKVSFKEEWAGKIAIISNIKTDAQDIYEMWKGRDEIEKMFHVFQNILDTDTPYVRREETLRGYVFCSFIALITYYSVLKLLKERELNSKVSVSDLMLELSKVYAIEIKEKMIISEVNKKTRELMKKLKLKNLLTKMCRS